MPPSSVWHVAREFGGMAEAGGVKDAVRGLALALTRVSVRVSVVLPLYGFMNAERDLGKPHLSFSLPMPDQADGMRAREEEVRVLVLEREGVRFLLVDSSRFTDKRDVYTYTAADEAADPRKKKGSGHWDSHQMNLILQHAALEAALASGEPPAVIHCHDGHAAFLPAIMRENSRFARSLGATAAVVTIHNAGAGYHQEIWDTAFARLVTGLPDSVLSAGMLNATVDPLLLSSSYAALSTVSEQYARELLAERDRELAGGLGRAFRERGVPLSGITNGVEPEPFDPRFPERTGLPYSFNPASGDYEGKRKCREHLLGLLKAPVLSAEGVGGLRGSGSVPLFGFIGRLTAQKGIDALAGALSAILSRGECPLFLVLGQGDSESEARFHRLAAGPAASCRLLFIPRYDPGLAKLVYAASDFLLIPSVYEPCGLTDFHAQLMGTIPVVHKVGGLVKVRDGETGFSYGEQSVEALVGAIDRALALYRRQPGLLDGIRRRAFLEIFEAHTWDSVARDGYIPLYERACSGGAWKER